MAVITASKVPARQRLAFLPDAFTMGLMVRGEGMVYHQAQTLCAGYKGGLWDFYRLSNGGYYLAPQTVKPFNVTVAGNDYEGEVSADAFGIIATLFVYGALCWIDNEELREKFSDHYHQLRDFARDHAEAGAILRAID